MTAGADLHRDQAIPFTTAIQGGSIDLGIQRANGKHETLTVKIPPGTQSGEILRLKGQGFPNLDGYGTGDQLIKVMVETPRKLTPRMRELFEELRSLETDHASPARNKFFEKLKSYFKG